MRRNTGLWLAASAGIMILLPWLAVTFVRSDAGMAAVLMLFFLVDPGYCILAGFCAGKQIRCLWWLPMVCSGLFLAGTWLLFEMGEPAFLLYAGIYFAMGMGAMLLSRLWLVRREKNGYAAEEAA